MNDIILIPVILIILVLIFWLVMRNKKDQKKIEGKGTNPLKTDPKDRMEEL